MTQTGGARPGPAPNAKNLAGVRETLKRGVVRQARRASRSAAFGLRPGAGAAQVHRQTKGVFVNSCRKSARPRIRQPWSLFSPAPDLSHGACARPPHRHRPPPPAGTAERGASTPAPSTKAAAGLGTGHTPVSAPEIRAVAHRSGLSAPGFGETLRDEVVTGINATHRDGGQRPHDNRTMRRTRAGHGTWDCRAVRERRCWRCAPARCRSE